MKLIYIANVSLDGFIEDASGSFEWTTPDEEVFAFTDLVRSVGTYLYGRRLYETMAVWETDATLAAQSEPMADFVGGGKPGLARDTRAELELVDERRFTSGVVYLRYRTPT